MIATSRVLAVTAAALALALPAGTALAAPAPVELGTPLPQAHAHNDYEHERPLLDALEQGFTVRVLSDLSAPIDEDGAKAKLEALAGRGATIVEDSATL